MRDQTPADPFVIRPQAAGTTRHGGEQPGGEYGESDAQQQLRAAVRSEHPSQPADAEPIGVCNAPNHAETLCLPEGYGSSTGYRALLMADEQSIRIKGTVVDVLRDAKFLVETEQGLEVVARAAGRMRRGRKIRILPGDTVEVDVSLYDPSKGRIVWRHK